MKLQIVLISGRQGSGKSTLAKKLGDRYAVKANWHVEHLLFAGTIYSLHDMILEAMTMYGIALPRPKKDGVLLQLLGTEWGRKSISEDVWVQTVINQVNKIELGLENVPNGLILISDCRFENEFDAFPDALRVRLDAPEPVRRVRTDSWRENTKHPSETGLDDYAALNLFDVLIDTEKVSVEGSVDLVSAQIDKGSYLEKR